LRTTRTTSRPEPAASSRRLLPPTGDATHRYVFAATEALAAAGGDADDAALARAGVFFSVFFTYRTADLAQAAKSAAKRAAPSRSPRQRATMSRYLGSKIRSGSVSFGSSTTSPSPNSGYCNDGAATPSAAT